MQDELGERKGKEEEPVEEKVGERGGNGSGDAIRKTGGNDTKVKIVINS
jgi:hypothetical protein